MKKKEICIALGSGGARSLAHIGVLQIFQEENIVIKKIAGTSAGAVVGAVFAETNDAFETQERFKTLLKSNAYERSGLGTLKDHTVHGANFWEQITTRIKGMIALSIAQSKLGVLRNKYLKECLEILTFSKDFSQLQIAFSAMATDLVSGCGVEIATGDIIKGLNATSAIPGFFPPVKIGDHLLVDGAVTCPVPVEHCAIDRDSVIVAVHVPSQIISGYQPENALDVMVRAEEISMRNLDQVKTARADIHIFPDIKDVGWNELHRLDEMVAEGRKAARKMLPQILKFINKKEQMCSESARSYTESMFKECRKFYIKL